VAETKILDDLPVSVYVGPSQVIQKPAAAADHLEEAAAAVVILPMGSEVIGEVVDPLREQGNLDAGRAGIGLVTPETLNCRCFFESH
jgi:hypothetical protein